MREALLKVDRRAGLTGAEALSRIREVAVGCGDPAWAILQSFRELTVAFWNRPDTDAVLAEGFGDIFSGRIFGARAEIRWVREGSRWDVWELCEGEDGVRFRADTANYYLWGIYKPGGISKPESGRFEEDRIPGVPEYPVLETPKMEGRAWVEVCEYAALISSTNRVDLGELERQLNQPRVAAHRFLRLHTGE